ncbi:MAG: DUF1573 domain-containing protein [Chitinophagaceae bacterium]
MKKIAFLLCIAATALVVACNSADTKSTGGLTQAQKDSVGRDSANFTTIQWLDSTVLDLGKTKEGTVVDISYRFKNTGDKKLIIEDVRAGCGCTIPEKPEQPFAPGEQGVIRAKFNSAGKLGNNDKYVTVVANTKPDKETVLHFKVEVVK